MYLKHYQLKQDPFSVPPDNQIFFPGGGREKVLQHVLEDLSGGMNLVHLSGEKGSGKTLLCQLIHEKLRSTQTVVLLSESSDTFDDRDHSIALDLGENDAKQLAGTKLYDEVLLLISNRADNGDSILLIIDDAETLAPSVLTRILRVACDAHPQRAVQFVLAGRLPLGANPEQFTAIRAEPLQQFTYTLQPLDREDTAHYLAFRLTAAGIPNEKQDSIFSAEAIARIHEVTCGNIYLINILSEEALRNSCKSKSFIVLSDHVKAPTNFSAPSPISISRPSPPPKTPLKIMTGIIVLIIAIVWTYNVDPVDTTFQLPINEPLAVTQEVPPSLADKLPVPPPPQTAPSLLPIVASETGKKALVLTEKYPEEKTTKAEKMKIVILTPDKTLKVRHEVEGRINIPERIQTNGNLGGRFNTQELYQKRTTAGGLWMKGEKNDLYTLQLMALKARNAEINMKKILNQKGYRQHADNFYIFRKMTVPETVFVFYGEYKNMASARLAKSSIPDVLRAHQPYAISIKEAMAKLRK